MMWYSLLSLYLSCIWVVAAGKSGCRTTLDKYNRIASLSRSIIYGKDHLWPGGVVPFMWGGYFPKKDREMIENSMKYIEGNSCVRFVERTRETNFVKLINVDDGCFTEGVGYDKNRGPQALNLDPQECMENYQIVHELLHALGFLHEHGRPDRDKFVKIKWENINPTISDYIQFSRAKYFGEKIPECDVSSLHPLDNCYNGYTSDNYGFGYDYTSVMHYSADSFSKSGKDTMVRLQGTGPMGNKVGMSPEDIQKLNKIYQC